jgi:predicted RNase H-like HicB family nuclease
MLHRRPRLTGTAEERMIREYVDTGLRKARYDKLEDGSFVAEVPALRGAIATGSSLEECRGRLAEVIEEWVLVRVSRGLKVPAIDGIEVAVTAKR